MTTISPIRVMIVAIALVMTTVASAEADNSPEYQTYSDFTGMREHPMVSQSHSISCVADPTGDMTSGSKAEGDITGACGSHEDGIVALALRVLEPSNPRRDASWWDGSTMVIWGWDSDGDNQDDYAVFLSAYGGELAAEVRAVNPDSSLGRAVCEAFANYDGVSYAVGFVATCVDAPASARVDAFISYDGTRDITSRFLVTRTSHAESSPPPAPAPAPAPTGGTAKRESARLAGSSRIDTAVEISKYAFPNGAEEVYIARADEWADTITGGSLTRGPILLVPQCGTIPAVVRAEIARLNPRKVVVLGGHGAVCSEMAVQARDA